MKGPFLTFLCLIILIPGYGQNTWDTGLIADSLKQNANAIIRTYTTEYERHSIDKYTMNVNYVVTILNKKGRSASKLLIHYDRHSEVTNIQGNVYNSYGKHIKKIKKNDIEDYAYNNDYTLFSDSRIKYYYGLSNNYPYTVEYNYRVKYNGIVGFPFWFPQKNFNISTEKAILIYKTPLDIEIKHKELNYDFLFDNSQDDNIQQYKWTATNLTSISEENLSPDFLDILPSVLLSPNAISYEGTTGDFTSWNSYGKWCYVLIQDRDNIPDKTVDKIRLLTDTIPGKREKVKAVYEYMQGKTRYVNVSLGIGGFQPIKAEEVDEKGYGDCKALSNYTKALLQCIGIKAYYAEIGSGSDRKIKFPGFPSANQTNHVILCVPDENDTIWLECTHQTIPFGYIGPNNSNRYAILITEEGGVLARTPKYETERNLRSSKMDIELKADGSAQIRFETEFNSYLYEDVFRLIDETKKEQKDILLNTLTAEGLDILDFSIRDSSDRHAQAIMNVNCMIKSYALKSGNRLFFEPNFLHKNSYLSYINDDREHDLYQAIGYMYNDSLSIRIPDNFSLEYLPENIQLSSVYGTYRLNYKEEGNEILVTRFLRINEGNYEASLFTEIDSFITEISKRENDKIILLH